MLSTIAIKKPSIVVVDDEQDLVELFSEMLKSNGYDVHAFTDPIAALKHVKDTPKMYSLLITDYRMDKLNGCELGIKIKELNNSIEVILISSYESIEGNRLGFELLNKPILIQTLLKKVKTYLKLK
ncbi:MAG TPA: response regulator [Nitrososphaeraceae archaeon]|jgi:DNA-binding NtrC family response regulator|nr:response regulator [Nitrososphaeraceae archaeon]